MGCILTQIGLHQGSGGHYICVCGKVDVSAPPHHPRPPTRTSCCGALGELSRGHWTIWRTQLPSSLPRLPLSLFCSRGRTLALVEALPVPPDSQTSGAGPGRETRPAACQVLTTAMMVVWHIKIMVELLSLWHHLHWCNQLLCYCGASVTWPPTDDNRSNNKMQLRFNHQAIYFHVCTIRAWAERGIRRSFQPWHGRRRWRWIMMMEVSGILPGETN